MTFEEYNRRAHEIEAWVQAEYAAGKLTEYEIESRAMRMYDALDEERRASQRPAPR